MIDAQIQARPAAASPDHAERRRLSATAAILAGLLAGAVLLFLLQLFATAVYDESAWKLFRMTAALVRGPAALEPDDEFDAALVAIGLLLHFALAVLYALALSCIVAETPRRYATVVGLAWGIALYFANFYGFTGLFPWFIPLRTFDTAFVHALFGVLVANSYWAFRK